jgi:hypothetical protein
MDHGEYTHLIVETFEGPPQSGRHGTVHVRALPGQRVPCDLMVESPKSMRRNYPVGTKFKITARLKYRGQTPFLYTSWQWAYEVVSDVEAALFVRDRFASTLTRRPTRTRGERPAKI